MKNVLTLNRKMSCIISVMNIIGARFFNFLPISSQMVMASMNGALVTISIIHISDNYAKQT